MSKIEKARRFIRSFTPYQTIYLLVVLLTTAAFVIFLPNLVISNSQNTLAFVCSVITVLANPLCEILISKQSKLNFIVDIFLIELTYVIICLNQGWYTLLITVVCFWIPIDVVSYIRWTKHPDQKDDIITEVRRLKPVYGSLCVVGIVLFGLGFGYLMQFLPGSQDSYLEAFASAIGISNGILLMLRYQEHWFAWLITVTLYIIMDIRGGAYILLITEVAMLVNTIYGYIKWLLYNKEKDSHSRDSFMKEQKNA